MYRYFLTLFFGILCILSAESRTLAASGSKEAVLFARYECKHNELTVGDSMVVNVVLFSDIPFQQAEATSKSFKVKGGQARKLPEKRLSQKRVRMEEGVFYALVLCSYVVSSEVVGEVVLPPQEFSATLVVYEQDHTDDFFSPFDFFVPKQRKYHTTTQKCKAEPLKIKVKEKPKRSTQEAIRSGNRVV